MKDESLKKKSFDFAVSIIKLFQQLQVEKKEIILCEKLLKCGTAIGAFVKRSEHAKNIEDYIHQLSMAQKKAHETVYCLELMHQSGCADEKQFTTISSDAREVCNLLDPILTSTKTRNN